MLLLGTFINNVVNSLIRNLNMGVRITISSVFFVVAIFSIYFAIKNQPKDKPGLRLGWTILALVSMLLSVLYIVL